MSLVTAFRGFGSLLHFPGFSLHFISAPPRPCRQSFLIAVRSGEGGVDFDLSELFEMCLTVLATRFPLEWYPLHLENQILKFFEIS